MESQQKDEAQAGGVVVLGLVASNEGVEGVHADQQHEVYYYRYEHSAVHYNNTRMVAEPILWILLALLAPAQSRVIGRDSPFTEILIIFVTFAAVSLLAVAIAIYLKDNDCIARTNRIIMRQFSRNILNEESEQTEESVTQGNNPLAVLNNDSFETNMGAITAEDLKPVVRTLKKSTRMDISIIEEN